MSTLCNLLSQPWIERLGWMLIHFVWQAAAVAVLLAVTLRFLRRSSSNVRYVTACAALALTVLLPLVTMQLVKVTRPAAEAGPSPLIPPTNEMAGELVLELPEIPTEPVTMPATPLAKADVTPPVPLKERIVARLAPALPYLVFGWLVGVFGLSAWHLGGWAQLQRFRRRMVRPVSDAVRDRVTILAERLGIHRAIGLLESVLVEVPTVVGWIKPVILLPASALTGLSGEQLEAILAHELAHIRRYDYLVNILQTVVEILGFYHPALWWISHRIRIERENCCDDLAVQVCGDSVRYARALTHLEEMRHRPTDLAVAADGGSLLSRIARLLGRPTTENRRFTWLPGLLALLLVAALILLAVCSVPARASKGTSLAVKEPNTTDAAKPVISPGTAVQRRAEQLVTEALSARPIDERLLRTVLAQAVLVRVGYRADSERNTWVPGVPTSKPDPDANGIRLVRQRSGDVPQEWIDILKAPLAKRPIVSVSLLLDVPDELRKEEDVALAEADKHLRAGVRRLAEAFPFIRNARDWQDLVRPHPESTNRLGFGLRHSSRLSKAVTSDVPVPEGEEFSILAVVQRPQTEIGQLGMFGLFPCLGLEGQCGASAGNPELDRQLKTLLAETLTPLEELDDRASRIIAERLRVTTQPENMPPAVQRSDRIPDVNEPEGQVLYKSSVLRVRAERKVESQTARELSRILDKPLDSIEDAPVKQVLQLLTDASADQVAAAMTLLSSSGYIEVLTRPTVLARLGRRAEVTIGSPDAGGFKLGVLAEEMADKYATKVAVDLDLWLTKVLPAAADGTGDANDLPKPIEAAHDSFVLEVPEGKYAVQRLRSVTPEAPGAPNSTALYLMAGVKVKKEVQPVVTVQAPQNAEDQRQVLLTFRLVRATTEAVLNRQTLLLISAALESDNPQATRQITNIDPARKTTLGEVLRKYVTGQPLSQRTYRTLFDLLQSRAYLEVQANPQVLVGQDKDAEIRTESERSFTPPADPNSTRQRDLGKIKYSILIRTTPHIEPDENVTVKTTVTQIAPSADLGAARTRAVDFSTMVLTGDTCQSFLVEPIPGVQTQDPNFGALLLLCGPATIIPLGSQELSAGSTGNLLEILQAIAQRTGMKIAVDATVKPLAVYGPVDVSGLPAATALQKVLYHLAGAPYVFKQKGDTLLVYKPLNASFATEELLTALERLSTLAEVPIVVDDKVTGKLMATMTDLTLEEALSMMLDGSPFAWKKMTDYYLVAGGLPHGNDVAGRVTHIVSLNYISPSEALSRLPSNWASYVRAGTPTNPNANAVLVTGPPALADEIVTEIVKLDQRPRQVLLTARVVEMKDDELMNLGVEWTMPIIRGDAGTVPNPAWPYGIQIGYSSEDSLPAKLDEFDASGRAEIVAKPQIAARNGYPAQVLSMDQEWFMRTGNATGSNLRKVDAGTMVTLTPRIEDNNDVQLEIGAEVSDRIPPATGNGAPVIARRQAHIFVVIPDGGTAAVGFRRDPATGATKDTAIFITAHIVPAGGLAALNARTAPFGVQTAAPENVSGDLLDVLQSIAKRTGTKIAVDATVKPLTVRGPVDITGMPPAEALKKVLASLDEAPYAFKERGDTLLVYKPISTTFTYEELPAALEKLAILAHVPIVIDEKVIGRVTAEMTDLTLEEALDMILAGTPFVYRRMPSDHYLITDDPIRPAFYESVTRRVSLNDTKPSSVLSALPSDWRPYVRAGTAADPGANIILVTGPWDIADRIVAEIVRVDQPPRRMLVTVQLVEVERSALSRLGLEWNPARDAAGQVSARPSRDIQIGSMPDRASTTLLQARLHQLGASQQADIVGVPQILVQEGHTMSLRSRANEYAVTSEPSIPLGSSQGLYAMPILAMVTPQVIDGNQIQLVMAFDVNDVTTEPQASISARSGTVSMIQDGGTVAVRGLPVSATRQRRASTQELLVFVTVKLPPGTDTAYHSAPQPIIEADAPARAEADKTERPDQMLMVATIAAIRANTKLDAETITRTVNLLAAQTPAPGPRAGLPTSATIRAEDLQGATVLEALRRLTATVSGDEFNRILDLFWSRGYLRLDARPQWCAMDGVSSTIGNVGESQSTKLSLVAKILPDRKTIRCDVDLQMKNGRTEDGTKIRLEIPDGGSKMVFLDSAKNIPQADANAEAACLVLGVYVARPGPWPSAPSGRQVELKIHAVAKGGGYPDVLSEQRIVATDSNEVHIKAVGKKPSAPVKGPRTDSEILVSVTPRIYDDGSVAMDVALDVNDLVWPVGGRGAPTAMHRTGTTKAAIASGGTVNVAGITYKPSGKSDGETREVAVFVTVNSVR